MKKLFSAVALIAMAGALSLSQPVFAQNDCSDLQFVDDILAQFPQAPEACLGIVERNGKQYAKFQAEITRIAGSRVEAKFLMPNGRFTDSFEFHPLSDARVTIAGREYRYNELARGQELNIYLPPDRWEMHIPGTEDFASSASVAVVTPSAAQPEPAATAAAAAAPAAPAAMLPKTASPVPLFAVLGGLFTALGAGLVLLRRRTS